MAELTLYAESGWESPWVFHAMVALEELAVPYQLEVVVLPFAPEIRAKLQQVAVIGRVPVLVDGAFALNESAAISEYLAEKLSPPKHPRIYPADLAERARVRQVMGWLRTSLMALRGARPTTSVFGSPVTTPLDDKARADAEDLTRVAERLIAPGRTSIASTWSVADADLALMLMRLVANGDAVPQRIADYARAQWSRPSVRAFLARTTG